MKLWLRGFSFLQAKSMESVSLRYSSHTTQNTSCSRVHANI